ncbi:hypothetical protein ACFW04_005804 [Cataglyphis niger]
MTTTYTHIYNESAVIVIITLCMCGKRSPSNNSNNTCHYVDAKEIYQKNKKPWYYNMSLSRETIVTVSRIRSIHYNFNYSLFRKNLIDNKSCSCGHPSQDINHIVFCCPKKRNKSTQLRSAIVSAGHQSMDIFDILKNPTNKICRLIIAFCKTCNIKI